MRERVRALPSRRLTQAWEAVIGLETHVQLNTATKAFCGCRNAYGGEPNSNVCPVCLGLPVRGLCFSLALRVASHVLFPAVCAQGSLPVLNEAALHKAWLGAPPSARFGLRRTRLRRAGHSARSRTRMPCGTCLEVRPQAIFLPRSAQRVCGWVTPPCVTPAQVARVADIKSRSTTNRWLSTGQSTLLSLPRMVVGCAVCASRVHTWKRRAAACALPRAVHGLALLARFRTRASWYTSGPQAWPARLTRLQTTTVPARR